MTLSRRLLLTNIAVIGGLAIMVIAAIWVFGTMSLHMRNALDEHNELILIDSINIDIAEAIGLLHADHLKSSRLREKLTTARSKITLIIKLKKNDAIDGTSNLDNYSTNHKNDQEQIVLVQATLDKMINTLNDYTTTSTSTHANGDNTKTDVSDQLVTRANEAIHAMEKLSAKTHIAVRLAKREATSTAQIAAWVVLAVAFGAVIIAVTISIGQYRSVMHPLNELRTGVRRIADRGFDHQLKPQGDREFSDLADDFNQMANELKDFYGNLEQQVSIKSRELVRSERLASVGYLAAGVAHEINNPLGIISTYTELSMQSLDQLEANETKEDLKSSMRIIHEEAHRCKSITEQLLALSRRSDDSRSEVNLKDAADDVVEMVSKLKQFRQKHVEVLQSHRTSTTPVILANGVEMKQLLLNLVTNSLEAVPLQTGRVTIKVSNDGKWATLVVTDNGRGMSADMIDRIFEPFFTHRAGEGRRGTGLGLSICFAIVESHGGDIHAESEGDNQGSRFVVRLPAAKTPHSQIPVDGKIASDDKHKPQTHANTD